MYPNIQGTIKAVLRGQFIALCVYVKTNIKDKNKTKQSNKLDISYKQCNVKNTKEMNNLSTGIRCLS